MRDVVAHVRAKCRRLIDTLGDTWSRIDDDDRSFTATVVGAGMFSCLLAMLAIFWN
jgi:hypothetical protein